MQNKRESRRSEAKLSAPPSPYASAAAAVADTTADGGSHVAAQVQNTERMPIAGGKFDKPSVAQLEFESDEDLDENDVSDAVRAAPEGLAKDLIAFNKYELTLEDLRGAFENAKGKGLDPNDPVCKSVQLLISSMGEEIEEFSIEGENDRDLITFKMWDQGGQKVRCLQ